MVVYDLLTSLKSSIFIEDLDLVRDGDSSEAEILEKLPKNNPKWWFKVEDGYILVCLENGRIRFRTIIIRRRKVNKD